MRGLLLRWVCAVAFLAVTDGGYSDAIGREVGMSASQRVPDSDGARILRDAEDGRPEHLYFAALLYLYGKGGAEASPARAAERFRRAAERGHAGSMVALGVLLRHGHGVRRDDESARAWFAHAARSGHVEGRWMLGVAELEAPEPDYDEARRLLTGAARDGSADAFHWLGVMAEYGLGLPEPDYAEAVSSYKVAGSKGHDGSTFHLGLAYAYGRGANQDYARALLLFQDGAKAGHAGSMYYVGLIALHGHGVPVDYGVARYWFARCVAANDAAFADRASAALSELEASLALAHDHETRVMDDLIAMNEPPPGLKW